MDSGANGQKPPSSQPQPGGSAAPGKPASKTDLSISWIVSKATAQADNRAVDGFKGYIKEKAPSWKLDVTDAKGSPAEAATLIENAVQRKSDVIILSMVDLRASKAALGQAQSAGIPVFTIDSGWTPGVIVDITSNNYVMSGMISSYLVDRLGGQGNVVAFKENSHHGVRKRGETLDVVLKENPGIKVLEEHNIDNTNFYEDTQKAMEDFLTRYGKTINAVWAGWDEPAQAAASAIQAAGFTNEEIFVVGIDGHPSAIEEIRKGGPFVATVAQAFERMGEMTGEYITAIVIDGKPAEKVIPSTTVYLESPLITPANLPAPGVLPWKVNGK
ncbi:MAG: substrate-binding domain-containing protein [Terrimesophilobacter sp.]